MSVSRKRALDHADEVVSVPKAHVRVTLRQGRGGVTLLHGGKALTRCYLNRSGIRGAHYMAEALGLKVPPLGSSVETSVSTGVLWRAVSISCLDFRKEQSWPILERLLEESNMQRGSGSDST